MAVVNCCSLGVISGKILVPCLNSNTIVKAEILALTKISLKTKLAVLTILKKTFQTKFKKMKREIGIVKIIFRQNCDESFDL
jgi:hypothetical protein